MAYTDKKNPFFSEEDDVSFSYNRQATDPFMETAEKDLQQLQDVRQKSMTRQLDSTRRAMASIYDSENIGIATAEELVQQGEQLDNIETKLDQVNQDMKTSQHHINNIKSIFGGIKNWWNGNKSAAKNEPVLSERSSRLEKSIDDSVQSQSVTTHPALRMRSEDMKEIYEDEAEASHYTKRMQERQILKPANQESEWNKYEEQLEENIDVLSSGLCRLKNLGLGLGDEIEKQNVQIDRVSGKAERADVTLSHQNKQMKHILK